MDFSWIYFMGTSKLGLTIKETGRLTLKRFNQMYKHYKDTFDLEMQMKKLGKTYASIKADSEESDKWF